MSCRLVYMSTYTAEQIEAIGGNRWQRNGRDRVYLNNWHELIGLYVEHYKTGNISYSELDGEKISHRRAAFLAGAKVYWENGEIHTTLRDAAKNANQDADALIQKLMEGIAQRVAEATK